MGCHTWFSRPIIQEEFELIKEYAPTEIFYLIGKTIENITLGTYNEDLYNLLMKSYYENVPCVDGQYWWQLGYGAGNPNLLDGEENYTRLIRGDNRLFIDVKEYHDLFRIKNYSTKVIHNRKELRKWMRKRYFELEDRQLERVSEFFREYPDGVITFG